MPVERMTQLHTSDQFFNVLADTKWPSQETISKLVRVSWLRPSAIAAAGSAVDNVENS